MNVIGQIGNYFLKKHSMFEVHKFSSYDGVTLATSDEKFSFEMRPDENNEQDFKISLKLNMKIEGVYSSMLIENEFWSPDDKKVKEIKKWATESYNILRRFKVVEKL